VPRPFASSEDLQEKRATLEELADGVYAYTAEGDPNVGAVVGPECVVAVDARATPTHARTWLDELRRRTDKPVRYLVLTHYHAVRTLGASAFEAQEVVAHEHTRRWILERGERDFESELRRFPRLFRGIESVPGLTLPTLTFDRALALQLGARELQVRWLGRGHTEGDAVVWLPQERVLFAGDLVEARAAPYMGDAFVLDWLGPTLDSLEQLGAETIVPGRGPAVRGEAAREAIVDTRAFLRRLRDEVAAVVEAGGTAKQAFAAAHAALEPDYGATTIFEHCMPFNVQRMVDELRGEPPVVWTAERDAQVWEELQA
jgi:glyoxylase-like metal-dependent hydrolase (beta-lactamase superfamily II)